MAELGWEIILETQIRNLRPQEKIRQEKNMRFWDKSEKIKTTTTNDTTGRDKSEGIGERISTKKIPRQDETLQIK